MKWYAIAFLSLFIIACSHNNYLEKEDLIPNVTYTWKGKISYSQKFYIVNIAQLKKARYPILYAGTIEGYHLFLLAPKGPVTKDEIKSFAVHPDLCVIDDPKHPDDEKIDREESDRSRYIKIENNKVVVTARSS